MNKEDAELVAEAVVEALKLLLKGEYGMAQEISEMEGLPEGLKQAMKIMIWEYKTGKRNHDRLQ